MNTLQFDLDYTNCPIIEQKINNEKQLNIYLISFPLFTKFFLGFSDVRDDNVVTT